VTTAPARSAPPPAPREITLRWRVAQVALVPPIRLLARYRSSGAEHLPPGAFVLAPNHYTNIDPVMVGYALWREGRVPRFLAKDSLFRIPVVGWMLRGLGQIPVDRSGRTRGSDPLGAAARLIGGGGGVIVYPEGTLTRDPDLWPMRGKTGAVRVALEAGVPVIPLAHWGAQHVLPPYGGGLRILPRRTVRFRFGPAVDLDAYRGRRLDAHELAEATGIVMAAITAELEQLRGGRAPAERWDPAEHGQSEYGLP